MTSLLLFIYCGHSILFCYHVTYSTQLIGVSLTSSDILFVELMIIVVDYDHCLM